MELKLLRAFNNLLLDLCITAYCRAFEDMGKSEREGLKQFTSKYVAEDLNDPGEILETYLYLKKLLNKVPQ